MTVSLEYIIIDIVKEKIIDGCHSWDLKGAGSKVQAPLTCSNVG